MNNTNLNAVHSEKSMNILMNTIDSVLQEIVWVNKNSEIVNLKMLLSEKTECGTAGCIESLPYEDLVGAYTCLQIRHEMFGESIVGKDGEEIAKRIKDMVFVEARARLISAGLCRANEKGELVCENIRKVA
ncbi:MAG: hypothetical protein LBU68_01660 [Rickettsiales bacterium]|jgi:hypothetical protein|nr:hypothetical protein [Rickettsiales bacterium]